MVARTQRTGKGPAGEEPDMTKVQLVGQPVLHPLTDLLQYSIPHEWLLQSCTFHSSTMGLEWLARAFTRMEGACLVVLWLHWRLRL